MSQKSPGKKKRDVVHFKFRYPSLKEYRQYHETKTCQRLDYEIGKQCVIYKDFTINRGGIRRIKTSNDVFVYTSHNNFIYSVGDSLALVN